jgi:hypothetical protein
MRTVLICTIALISIQPLIAQRKPEPVPAQNPTTISAAQRVDRRGPQRLRKSPTRGNTDVPPNAPVVTLEGVCDRSQKNASVKDCKTVITRAQMDALINVLQPDASPMARRQFAITYARLIAASDIAEQRHLDVSPAVVKELQVQLKLARMQVLTESLLQAIQRQTEDIPDTEIQKYYTEHQGYFEQAGLQRVYVPKSAATESGQPLDSAAVKARADELHARAAAGEEFDMLQQEAYKSLGIKATPPPTRLGLMPRSKLSPDEAKVFDLAPGDVTQVLESQDALIILKLESKQTISVESARPEIEALLLHDRMQDGLREATKSVKAQFNLKYLESQTAPELFPPSLMSPASGRRGITARP